MKPMRERHEVDSLHGVLAYDDVAKADLLCGVRKMCLAQSLARLRAGFLFSSRKRHTNYIGDWSSDVCSSDLPNGTMRAAEAACRPRPRPASAIYPRGRS